MAPPDSHLLTDLPHSFLNALQEGVVVTDIERRIQFVNASVERLTGRSREQLLGHHASILGSGQRDAETAAELREAFTESRPWRGRFQNRRRLPDGSDQNWWAAATIAPLQGTSGQTIGWISLQQDVTAEVQNEQAAEVARLDAELRAEVSAIMAENRPLRDRITDVLTALVRMHDAEWQRKAGFFLANGDAKRLELFAHVGKYSDEFLDREQIVNFGDCLCGRAAASGETIISDDCFADDRHEHVFEGMQAHGHYIVPAVAGGAVRGVLFLYTDPYPSRTESRLDLLNRVGELLALALAQEDAYAELRRGREEAVRAARSRAAFLANMSHEIRTPMNGVLGMAELLGETALDPEQRDMLDTVQASAETLLHILNDILDVSKIEAGGMTIEQIPLDPVEVVEDIASLLATQANKKDLELICDVADGVPRSVLGDPVRLRQVLTNLTGNAIKFTQTGEIVIRLTHEKTVEDVALLRIDVSDSGIGIAADRLDAVFDSFSQADDSTTREFGGTGLGLSISRQLVELMGGKVTVDSELGKGSEFHIHVPLPLDSQEEPERIDVHGCRVLVVDDNETNRRILRERLEEWSCEVLEADSGAAAIALLGTSDPTAFDLLLLDHHMPVVSGVDLAHWVHEREGYRDIPKVMLTSGCAPDASTQRACGLDAVLPKPVRRRALLRTIERALSRPATVTKGRKDATEDEANFGLNVLLAEDNAVNQKVASILLRKLGCEVTIAHDGLEAVQHAQHGGFDLILMDLQMPNLDGIDAAIQIREHETAGDFERVPIVALSAHVMDAERQRCLEAGMDKHLGKPIDSSRLRKLLAEIAEARSAAAGGGCGTCALGCPPKDDPR